MMIGYECIALVLEFAILEERANIGRSAAARRANNKSVNGHDYCACISRPVVFLAMPLVIGEDRVSLPDNLDVAINVLKSSYNSSKSDDRLPCLRY